MIKYIAKFIVVCSLLGSTAYAAESTHAEEAVKKSAQASGNASASAAHSIAASGQVTSAAIAVPLKAVGAVGAASAQAGDGLSKAASAPIGTPLQVTDEAITAGPLPSEAMKPKKQ